MDVAGRTVWQIAAGDTDRAYHDLCLRWDVVLYGPGKRGWWPECSAGLTEDGETARKIGLIGKFATQVSPGDLVVLRLGTRNVYGVGEVVGDYEWLDDFGDVDGWDLQHVRRVRWLWKYGSKPKSFAARSMKWGGGTQLLTSKAVLRWVKGIEVPGKVRRRPLVRLPSGCVHASPATALEMDEIAEELYDQGLGWGAIEALRSHIDDMRRVGSWYQRADEKPSESETVAYLVVPLLRALGWTPQRMAVEWGKIDVALFNGLPREDGNLGAAVEVKKRNRSCLSAREQAAGYADVAGRESCLRLIVTDGIRYGVYVREAGGAFPDTPTAYLNLERLMRSYPVLECEGATEAIRLMAADWYPRA